VFRILQLGYNVMWSDVDIFWKIDAIPGMLAEMEDFDIGIQSNAPPAEHNDNGRRRINSGFYFVRNSPQSLEAFRQIVEHASATTLSEQPSFYSILCGDDMEYVEGPRDCVNTKIPVKTRLLSRKTYPNGAMTDVIRGVTPESGDDVAIVHFNWLEGHENKVGSFVNASMWLLDDRLNCMYSHPVRSRR
jgi:beta-arabinofuranosyltransferase